MDLSWLFKAIDGRTKGEWTYTCCYGVATIEAPRGEAVAHAVDYLIPDNAEFIATMGTCADDLKAVIEAANGMFRDDPVIGLVTDIGKSFYLREALAALAEKGPKT